jgi:hypothetical protein
MLMVLISDGLDRTLNVLTTGLLSEYKYDKSCSTMATWQRELSKIPKRRLHEVHPASDTGQYQTK